MLKHLISALFFIVLLVGCSYKPAFIQYRDKHYLTAQNAPPLRIPPGLSSSAFHNEYPVPYRNYPESVKDVDVTPPGLHN